MTVQNFHDLSTGDEQVDSKSEKAQNSWSNTLNQLKLLVFLAFIDFYMQWIAEYILIYT